MPVLPEPSATEETSPPDQGLAVAAESLYLINLLLVPGLAFLVLLWLYRRHRNAPPMARQHLRQTLSASLWAGALLVITNLLIIALGGYAAASTWVIVILYFTTVHATLVMLGILGLAKALAGQLCSYPLIGELLP
ncbi:MAG TPA: hypothetical protein P5149_06600 [Candidatus Competibacteraceae bacterium]|nr:hypothetical protein [Candidatus Competibacteraceae bacterium]MCP5459865.1 hypothetical protein [Gammaproteobacteria bacterium]HPF58593.1 hypothetical protein [Candidatus Competibacteraceae bacterium]HRY18063.1 hypothetical protein [Candidatus Competibacteraceae bacterium]